jgi:hypothetical protein
LAALAKGQFPPNTPQQCVNDQVGGSQGTQTVGGVQIQTVDAAGSTSHTGAAAQTASATDATATTTAVTTKTQAGAADASAASARLVSGSSTIQLGAMTSSSKISCTYGASGATFSFNGHSTVQSLKINGKAIQLHNGEMAVPVSGGTLYLNRTKTTATGIVQQAAVLVTNGATVTLGESAVAIAQTKGNPCMP